MPRRTNAPLSHADALAEAAQVWGPAVPSITTRPGVDYTQRGYADHSGYTLKHAQTLMEAKRAAGELKRGRARVNGAVRPEYVYWPATVEPPAGVVAE